MASDGNRFWVMSVHLKSACFAQSLKQATVDPCKTLAIVYRSASKAEIEDIKSTRLTKLP